MARRFRRFRHKQRFARRPRHSRSRWKPLTMSKRVPVVRRKAAKRVPSRKATVSQKPKPRTPAKGARANVKKAVGKVAQRAVSKKATPKKVVRPPAKPVVAKKPTPKRTVAPKAALPAKARGLGKAAKPKRTIAAKSIAPKRSIAAPAKAREKAKVTTTAKQKPPPKVAPKPVRETSVAPISQAAPLTPRSIAPPPLLPEQKVLAKTRTRTMTKTVLRGAYVSPAQRVLEAQQAAQMRSRRVQVQKEEAAERRIEPVPASEAQPNVDSGAVSSELRTSTSFVRRGRLGPRDPASSPLSETATATAVASGSFDAEWRRIERVARQVSVNLDREPVQSWLEPWLSGKDTLALIQSALDSGAPYFIATQALERKTLLVERSNAIAAELAQRFTRLGLKVWAIAGTDDERRDALNQFTAAPFGTLIVPLAAFDDNNLFVELQQLKLNGLVAEEAQRVSELSFDFDVAYDRIPNIVSRLGRPPTLAILRSAPPSVRTDLPHRLGLRSAQRIDLQPLPDTVGLEVPVVDVPHRGGTLIERLSQAASPTMVLCSSPEEVDEVVEVLGRASLPFRGSSALSAVGMGHLTTAAQGSNPSITIGISGLPSSRDPLPKTIIHYRAPASLEQYARDLGRLDTSVEGASAVVLAATEDETQMRQWLERQRPRPEELIQVATLLSQHAGPGKMALVDTLAASYGTGRARLESLLSLLANAGWIEHKMDWVRVPETCTDLLDRARALAARLKSLRERDHQRMRSVSAYVIGRNCRHESMRRHFGTAAQRPCGVCDNCRTKAAHAAANGSSPPSEPVVTPPTREPEVIFE